MIRWRRNMLTGHVAALRTLLIVATVSVWLPTCRQKPPEGAGDGAVIAWEHGNQNLLDHLDAAEVDMPAYESFQETEDIATQVEATVLKRDEAIDPLTLFPVDADHVTICKPANRQQPLYRRTERILAERLQALQTPANAAVTTPQGAPALNGEQRLAFAQRLGDSWAELADLLEIPGHQRRGFAPGQEPRAILDWLEERHRITELAPALVRIGRPDLAALFPPHP